ALQNLYWRSKRPGLPADQAESLKDLIAGASYESRQTQEPQQRERAAKETFRARRPRLVKGRDTAGAAPELSSSGTRDINKNIIHAGFGEPEDPVDAWSEAEDLGATKSTYSVRPTHLSEREVQELMSRPDMKVTDTKGAGAARPHRHHLFIQARREWFRERGILIDRYTIEMSQGEHSAYHTMGWRKRTEDFISSEKGLGREHSPIQILRFGVSMRRQFQLKGRKIVPYEN